MNHQFSEQQEAGAPGLLALLKLLLEVVWEFGPLLIPLRLNELLDPSRQNRRIGFILTVPYGLIAEEVAKVYPELVTKRADGKVESVQYHELVVF